MRIALCKDCLVKHGIKKNEGMLDSRVIGLQFGLVACDECGSQAPCLGVIDLTTDPAGLVSKSGQYPGPSARKSSG